MIDLAPGTRAATTRLNRFSLAGTVANTLNPNRTSPFRPMSNYAAAATRRRRPYRDLTELYLLPGSGETAPPNMPHTSSRLLRPDETRRTSDPARQQSLGFLYTTSPNAPCRSAPCDTVPIRTTDGPHKARKTRCRPPPARDTAYVMTPRAT